MVTGQDSGVDRPRMKRRSFTLASEVVCRIRVALHGDIVRALK